MTTTFEGELIPQEKLPVAMGWRVLIAPIRIQEKTAGGIIIPGQEIEAAKRLRFVGRVLAMGPLCFTRDEHREHKDAPIKPWYNIGDIVSTSQYAGSELPCNFDGERFYLRMINDEEVVSIIPDISILDI